MDEKKYIAVAYTKAAELANVEGHLLIHQLKETEG